MKSTSIILVITLLFGINAKAHQWDSIGPANVHVHNFAVANYNLPVEILCTHTGIMINVGSGWTAYENDGIPAWYATGLDPDNILVLMGSGSATGGVYKFNLTSHQFEIIKSIVYPNFLHYCDSDGYYYAGGEDGVWKSTDGINFDLIDYFDGKKGVSFAWYENHYFVSSDYRRYFSSDYGVTWTQSGPGMGYWPDIVFHPDGTLYGIFPSDTYSSGVWKSYDYGETWDPEYYNMGMSAVGVDMDGHLFVGWESYGVGLLDPDANELLMLNEGLPDLHINKITTHPNETAPNVLVCTDNGAWMLTEYPVGLDPSHPDGQQIYLNVFPNPCLEISNIVFSVEKAAQVNLCLLNHEGQKMRTIFSGEVLSGVDHKAVFTRNNLAAGIYFLRLKTNGGTAAVRKILIMD